MDKLCVKHKLTNTKIRIIQASSVKRGDFQQYKCTINYFIEKAGYMNFVFIDRFFA